MSAPSAKLQCVRILHRLVSCNSGSVRLLSVASRNTTGKKLTTADNQQEEIVGYLQVRPREELVKKLDRVMTRYDKNVKSDFLDKIEFLVSLGCTLPQILCNPSVLKLSEYELLKCVDKLRACGCETTSVDLILMARVKGRGTLQQRLVGYNAIADSTESREKAIQERLGCTAVEFDNLSQKVKILQSRRSFTKVLERITHLYDINFSLQDVLTYPRLLESSHKRLQSRHDMLTSAELQDDVPTWWYVMPEKVFKKRVKKLKRELIVLEEEKYAILAELLGVTEERIREMKYIHDQSLKSLKQKMRYLLARGIQPDDILVHESLLQSSLNKIKQACQRAVIDNGRKLTMTQIRILMDSTVDKVTGMQRNTDVVAAILEMDPEDMDKTLVKLASVDIYTLRTNFKLLEEEGFSLSDIQACPIVLGHDTEVLHHYLGLLEEKLGEATLTALTEDKTKLLNALQLIIEVDHKFEMMVRKEMLSSAVKVWSPDGF